MKTKKLKKFENNDVESTPERQLVTFCSKHQLGKKLTKNKKKSRLEKADKEQKRAESLFFTLFCPVVFK